MSKKLCLIIPTKDRPKAIEAYLASQAEIAGKLHVDIIIQDSSTEAETQRIVQAWQKKSTGCIKYVRYEEKSEANAIDDKVKAICCKTAREYDYLSFSSDGTIIQLDRLLARAGRHMEQNAELIVNGAVDIEHQDDFIVDTPECLLEKCMWRMLSLSSTIVSSELMRACLEYDRTHMQVIQDLWIPTVYFRVFEMRKRIRSIYLYVPEAIVINPHLQVSFWQTQGLALWQWGERWCEVIDSLPSKYDAVKDTALRSHDRYCHVFSPLNMIRMRAYGNLSMEDIRRHLGYIPRVTNTPIWVFWLTAVLIRPRFARTLKIIRRRVKEKDK